MSTNVIITANFQREAKPLIKKYHSLKSELLALARELEENPKMGTLIKENTYKIRVAIKSKGKGKSGGIRVITYVEAAIVETNEITDVYLLSVYDKSDYASISDSSLENLVHEIKVDIQQKKLAASNEEE